MGYNGASWAVECMLFNSYEFNLLFLPLTCAGYFLLAQSWGGRAAHLWLILASLFFSGWWNPIYLPLLGAVMVFTYAVGLRLSRRPSKPLLAFGVAVLLGVLGYFKYANLFVENADALLGADWAIAPIRSEEHT